MDAGEKNGQFRDELGLEFELVSDPGKELASKLGILVEYEGYGTFASRVTFLLDPDGTILRRWDVQPEEIDSHAEDVLRAARA